MSDPRGFTLMEVAVAMAIIGIALVPATNLWVNASKATAATDQLALATNLAQRTLESKIRDVAFDNQQAASGIDPQTGLQFTLAIASESIPGYSAPTLRRVQVTVSLPGSATPIAQLVTLTAREKTL